MRFFKKLFRRRGLERDLEEELSFHLEMLGGDRKRFGNPSALKEACRDLWVFGSIESCWQDLRYAARTIAKTPGVTVVAAIALALGIGANAMVFTVISRALNIDLGVADMDRLVVISAASQPLRGASVWIPDLRALRSQMKSVDRVAAYRIASMNVSDRASLPERYWGAQMTATGFAILGRAPALGRVFDATDERPGATPVTVLSHRVWEQRYGASPAMLGSVIRVDDTPRVVIGVMPPGVMVPEDVDLWTPLDARAPAPQWILARLASGVKVAAARAEIDAAARAVTGLSNSRQPAADVHLLLDDYGRYAMRPMYFAMFAAVGFVLLIACADVANLLLARAAERGREISVRIAIGAGRARIIRQLLIESVLLAAIGGFFGWLTALGALRWFDRATAAANRPAWIDFSMDWSVFLYLASVSIGTGILFGLAPALRLAKVDVNEGIKDGGHAASGGMRGRRLSNLLVGAEVLLCVVLLAGAGLLIRSTLKVYGAPLGVNPAKVLTMHVNLPVAKYPRPEDQVAFHRQLNEKIRAIAGVESAGVTSAIPTWGFGMIGAALRLEDGASSASAGELVVSADYFRVMQVQPVRGRLLEDSSNDEVVVNEGFAAKYWPGQDPVGKRVRLETGAGPRTWLTVAGVIANIQQDMRRPLDPVPLIYVPYEQAPQRVMFVVARTAVPPATLGNAFRGELRDLDENLPAYDVATLESRVTQNRLEVGGLAMLFTMFAGVALVLAAAGIYGVIAHAVSRRTREIGIRMALGGGRKEVAALVLAQGMRPVAMGVLLGLPAALGLTRVLRRTLVGVSPGDPMTFAGVVLVLIAVGLLGCAIPARRAVRVDPLNALRHE